MNWKSFLFKNNEYPFYIKFQLGGVRTASPQLVTQAIPLVGSSISTTIYFFINGNSCCLYFFSFKNASLYYGENCSYCSSRLFHTFELIFIAIHVISHSTALKVSRI